ncbi:DMT family transporter [Agromyces aureus]|uniref:Cation transporter n=1 Tax=Agromyces aureus TaxID=453304 RepID=A0A191WHX4_9MICO|nr:multidrug efflux SMR transporter [Agromyces aureus]ANJ27774.1 cation transporter [Agromyces aureus]
MPRTGAWAVLALTIALEVTATLSLDAAQRHPWLYAVVVVGYAGSFVLLSQVLRMGMPLGVAYGIWGATGVALTAVLAWALFGDPLTPTMLAGIGLVAAGVLLVELGSQQAARRAQASGTTGTTDTAGGASA